MDILFVIPSNAAGSYQALAIKYAAIEPPTWALILAESARSFGATVGILDCLAENLSDKEVANRVEALQPSLICFVAYGQNVNAGTANMAGVVRTASYLKSHCQIDTLIGVIGSHVQSLPVETLEREQSVDFVFLNEGVMSLKEICEFQGITRQNLPNVSGLCIRLDDVVKFTSAPTLVPQQDLESLMPGYAWDLLPYRKQPFDLYRSPLWHADYQEEYRSPYAAIQTSIGCNFRCSFCMINIVNRTNLDVEGVAGNYNGMRFWPTSFVRTQFEKLVSYGVRTIRITDEMFLLNKKYYLPLCRDLTELNTNDELRIWAYSRIDTVPDFKTLRLIRKAGIRWLCLGIESGKQKDPFGDSER